MKQNSRTPELSSGITETLPVKQPPSLPQPLPLVLSASVGFMEINPEHSLQGLMLRLKLQYFGHLMEGANLLEKTLMLGKTEGKRRRGRQRLRRLDGIADSMDVSLNKLQEW